MPIIASDGIFDANDKSGIDKIRAQTEILIQPNLSAKIPPKLFPNTIAIVNAIRRLKSDFHGNITIKPTRERIAIDNNINKIINSKYLLGLLVLV